MFDAKTLASLRSFFENVNDYPLGDRLTLAAPIERWQLDLANHYGIPHNGTKLRGWERCRTRDDRIHKRDIQVFSEGRWLYGQCKFRVSGGDIGVALIQPFEGKSEVLRLFRERSLSSVVARDFRPQNDSMITYVVLSQDWQSIYFVPHDAVFRTAALIFKEWLQDDTADSPSQGRPYRSERYEGCQIRFKKDSGHGSFDSGVPKLICYISPRHLTSNNAEASSYPTMGPGVPSPNLSTFVKLFEQGVIS